jgi:PAT family beta-lactamase induction signal transducer AmpG
MTLEDGPRQRALFFFCVCCAEGIPLGFIKTALNGWLITHDVSSAAAARITAMITLGFAFKCVWGPLVDGATGSSMGRKRPLILAGQLGMALFAVAMAALPESPNRLVLLGGCVFLLALCLALQDVATDGLIMDMVPEEERVDINATILAAQIVGYATGAAALSQALQRGGERAGHLGMAAALCALALVPFRIRERAGDAWLSASRRSPGPRERARQAFPWRGLARATTRPDNLLAMVVIAVYATGSGVTQTAFQFFALRRCGWREGDFDEAWGLTFAASLFVGAILGAVVAKRQPPLQLVAACAVALGAATVAFGAGGSVFSVKMNAIALWAVWGAMNGAGTVALLAILQRLCWPPVAATHLAIFTSVNYLGLSLGAWLTGELVDTVSYRLVFTAAGLVVAAMAIPVSRLDVERVLRGYARFEPTGDAEGSSNSTSKPL